MKGEFEKNIERKLSDFKLEPSPQVWRDVEDALLQSRKRKIAGWWWIILPVLLFLVSGGIWWMNSKTINNSSKIVTGLNLNNIDTGGYKEKSQSSIAGSTGVKSDERANRIKTHQDNTDISKIINNRREKFAGKTQPGDRHLFTEDHPENCNNPGNPKDVSVLQNNKMISKSHKQKDSSIVNQSIKENATKGIQRKTGKTDSSDKNVFVKDKQNNTLLITSNASGKNESSHIKKYKHQWLITASGGFMTVKERSNLFSPNQNPSSPTLTTGASNGGNAVNRSIQAANNGYSFGIGFMYSQSINKRWKASAGVQYHYLQNKQPVGLDSLPINSTQTYFSSIQTGSPKTNYAHWLQLPLSLQYTLNPSFKYQLELSGGASIAWAFSEKWLITDKTNTAYPYHYNNELNNKFIGNLHLGIGLNCNDKFRLFLQAEQSLTPIHKNTTDKYYWQQFSLQIGKPLHLSSHQNKTPKT